MLYLLAGSAANGFKLAFNNLVLTIAPEEKRPIYVAAYNNITSLGLFFSISGGLLLDFMGYKWLIYLSIGFMVLGLP